MNLSTCIEDLERIEETLSDITETDAIIDQVLCELHNIKCSLQLEQSRQFNLYGRFVLLTDSYKDFIK